MLNVDLLFICGDFNARVGDLVDYIEDIDVAENRQVLEKVKGGHYECVIEFLKDSKLCILNGRVTPTDDNYTCISEKGKSVVDYIVTPYENVINCDTCCVELTSDLIERYDCVPLLSENCKAPDHSLVSVYFRLLKDEKQSIPTNVIRNEETVNKICVDKFVLEN